MCTKVEIERSDADTESNRERERRWNQKPSKTILQTQNTVNRKTKPNSLLKAEIKTRYSSAFLETQKSKSKT